MTSLAKLGGKIGPDKPAGVLQLTPKLSFAATGLILAVALIWVGVIEKQGRQGVAAGTTILTTSQPPATAPGWEPERLITTAASGTVPANAGASFTVLSRDNVSVLAYSSAVMVALTMILLTYGLYRELQMVSVHNNGQHRRAGSPIKFKPRPSL